MFLRTIAPSPVRQLQICATPANPIFDLLAKTREATVLRWLCRMSAEQQSPVGLTYR